MALKGVQYGGELEEKLFQSSAQMEKLYGVFEHLLKDPKTKEAKLQQLIDAAELKLKSVERSKADYRAFKGKRY